MNLPLDSSLIVIALAAIVVVLFVFQMRATKNQTWRVASRPTYDELGRQSGQAIETGRRLHVGLGRASLGEGNLASSVAAQSVLTQLAQDSAQGREPPTVTLGEATLLPLAQASLQASLPEDQSSLKNEQTQFVASKVMPYVYAAGAMNVLQQPSIGGNVLVGHYGAEIAFMADVADKRDLEQLVGSDDPLALAIAFTYTKHLLIGEEFLAAQAHIAGQRPHLVSLQIQNLLRLTTILLMIALAVLKLLGFDVQAWAGG